MHRSRHLKARVQWVIVLAVAAFMLLVDAHPVQAEQTTAERLAEYYGTGCSQEEEQRDLYLTEPAMRGDDVLELQRLLMAQGYDVGTLDGVFGRRTRSAVVQFQADHGQPADGRASEVTWQSIAGASPAAGETGVLPRPVGDLMIIIHVPSRRLTLLADGMPYASFPIAVGKASTPTPVGEWRIVEKSSGWGGGFGIRWLGLNVPWGTYGIHGTNKPWSVGRPLSGGCIRMSNENVVDLWDWVPMGTRVIILGPPQYIPEWAKEPLRRGAQGWVVLDVQRRLRERGYDAGTLDGRFGLQTEQAVRHLQRNNGLPETGQVTRQVYKLLGM